MLRILAFLLGLFPVIALAQSIPDSSVSGSIAATNQSVTIPTNGRSCVGLSITGTWSGALTVKVSVDYSSVGAASATYGTSTAIALSSGTVITGINGGGVFQINSSGFSAVQIFGTNIASGTANIALLATNAACAIMADNPFPVTATSQYPLGSVVIGAAFSGADTTTASATLAGTTAKTTYVCGFTVSGLGATSATPVSVTVATLVGSITPTYSYVFSAGATTLNTSLSVIYPSCIPASAAATGIVLTVPGAAGNTATQINAWGYQL